MQRQCRCPSRGGEGPLSLDVPLLLGRPTPIQSGGRRVEGWGPQSGSLGLSAAADPSLRCQPSAFAWPRGEPGKDAPEFGFLQRRLPVAAVPRGELPAPRLGRVRHPCRFELGSGGAERTEDRTGLSLALLVCRCRAALVLSARSCFSPKASTTWKGSLWTGWGTTSTGRTTAPKRPSAWLGWRRPPRRGRR